MTCERVVFAEEKTLDHHIKLVALGDVDETLLMALENYIQRQRMRLCATPKPETN